MTTQKNIWCICGHWSDVHHENVGVCSWCKCRYVLADVGNGCPEIQRLMEYTADQLDTKWSTSKRGIPWIVMRVAYATIYITTGRITTGRDSLYYVFWYGRSGEKKEQKCDSFLKLFLLIELIKEAVLSATTQTYSSK